MRKLLFRAFLAENEQNSLVIHLNFWSFRYAVVCFVETGEAHYPDGKITIFLLYTTEVHYQEKGLESEERRGKGGS